MASTTDDSGDFESALVEIPVSEVSVDHIVRFLVDTLVRQGRLSSDQAEQISELIMCRESLGSTAIGRGIALPQTQTNLIQESIIVMGRCVHPVHWPLSLDGEPVGIVCLVISPASPGAHAKALESVAHRLRAIHSE